MAPTHCHETAVPTVLLCGVAGLEVTHLGQAIDNHEDGVMSYSCGRQRCDQHYRCRGPWPLGDLTWPQPAWAW